VLGREGHVGQDVGLGVVHQGGELGRLWPQLVGDAAPLLAGGFAVVLGEGGRHEGRHDAPPALAGPSAPPGAVAFGDRMDRLLTIDGPARCA
jgi:hypothetical protein